ncbi:DoxX family protein [Actinomycetota bacterium]
MTPSSRPHDDDRVRADRAYDDNVRGDRAYDNRVEATRARDVRDDRVYSDRGYDDRVGVLGDGEAHSRLLDVGLLLLRLFCLALVFHGINKITHASGFIGGLENFPVGKAAPTLFGWMIILGQIFLPLLVAIGLFTRWAAALIAIMMVAIWIFVDFMSPDYSFLGEHGEVFGESALQYAWLTIPLIFTGAGRYSLDWNMFGRKRHNTV